MQLFYASAAYRIILIASLWCMGIVFPQSLTTRGPTNITRSEGDVDEFIPCLFDRLEATPFWKINEIFYQITQLPYPLLASSNSSGIIIKSITRYLNGSTFQCFVASGSKSDPRPFRSSIGTLTVIFDPQSDPPISSGSGSIVIQLTHQQLHFSQDNITLAWSLFDKDADSDISQPNSLYTLDVGDCNPENVSANFSVSNKTLVLSSEGLDSNSYINITLPFQSISIDERFRIKHGVVTNDIQVLVSHAECSCIDIPEHEYSPYFAIPRSPTSIDPDIRCLAISPAPTIDQCYSLMNLCGDNNLDNSIYAHSIRICGDSTGTKFKMCFYNITTEMNNTRVHFYYSRSPRCRATRQRVPSKLYIASYKVIIQANNNSFSPIVNTTTGEICFSSQLRYCYQSVMYSVSIFDVTGYLAYKQEDISPGTCLSTPIYEDSTCAPFTVVHVVNTNNPQQSPHSQTQIIATDTTMNPCQCAMQKVHLEVSKAEAGTSIIFRCNHSYASDINITIEVQAVNSAEATKEFMNCSREYNISIQCGRSYTLKAALMPINNAESQCVLQAFNVTAGCGQESTSAQVKPEIIAGSAVAAVLAFMILITTTSTIVIVWALKVCKRHRSQDFKSIPNIELTKLSGPDPNIDDPEQRM